MAYKRIDHIAFAVADLDRSIEFYERHFGFIKYAAHPAPNGMEIAYLRLADTVLEFMGNAQEAHLGGFHFCLETDDFDDAVKELSKNQVPVYQKPHNVPPREAREQGWQRAVFLGPDGEQIEIRG